MTLMIIIILNNPNLSDDFLFNLCCSATHSQAAELERLWKLSFIISPEHNLRPPTGRPRIWDYTLRAAAAEFQLTGNDEPAGCELIMYISIRRRFCVPFQFSSTCDDWGLSLFWSVSFYSTDAGDLLLHVDTNNSSKLRRTIYNINYIPRAGRRRDLGRIRRHANICICLRTYKYSLICV